MEVLIGLGLMGNLSRYLLGNMMPQQLSESIPSKEYFSISINHTLIFHLFMPFVNSLMNPVVGRHAFEIGTLVIKLACYKMVIMEGLKNQIN